MGYERSCSHAHYLDSRLTRSSLALANCFDAALAGSSLALANYLDARFTRSYLASSLALATRPQASPVGAHGWNRLRMEEN